MLKLLAFKQLCPFLKPQPETRTLQKKLYKIHHHQKKIQDPLLPQNTKDDEKKSSKHKNIESKKSLKKKFHKNSVTKKNQQKPYKNQKVSGKRRKPTTSLQQSTGLKRLVASTTSIIPYRPQTEETDSKRRHRMGDAPRATS